jgi:superfamily I DNA/RNA helicase
MQFHHNPKGIVCRGPDGRPPEILEYETEDELLRILQRLLHKLVNEEKVKTQNIAIVTPRSQEKSVLKVGQRLGNFRLTHEYPRHPNNIQVSSIHRFKGLERQVIILGEIDNRYNFNADMVMYVGCSRARTQLYIVHDKQVPSNILLSFNS